METSRLHRLGLKKIPREKVFTSIGYEGIEVEFNLHR